MEQPSDFIAAVKAGDGDCVETLLAREPELARARDESGVSVVAIARYYGHPSLAVALAARRDDLDLFEAAVVGDAARIAALLDAEPATAFSPDGFTALHLAVFFGHKAAAELLVARGAPINSVAQNSMRVMPLHSALANQDHDSAEWITAMLVDSGAEIDAAQSGGFRPLHEAAMNGYFAAARLLLSRGADVTATTDQGKTPLALAEESGHAEVADLLRGAGA